jgi:hypothetical protein
MRSNNIDDCIMRFEFFAKKGPDADKCLALCRALFDTVRLTLSDATTIRLSRQQTFFAQRDEENPDSGLYRASIDFQFLRQY